MLKQSENIKKLFLIKKNFFYRYRTESTINTITSIYNNQNPL
jgi:hypothetical protein